MPTTMLKTVSAEAHLRARNQITIPDSIVRAVGIQPGETFVVEVEPEDGDTLRLRRVRTSYAGALRGLWGADADVFLEAERNAWE
jgi:bifunctional DNA-binding transcriptional regulator/antitoxin component of YhaV-PrlF toxin-antitoxin module